MDDFYGNGGAGTSLTVTVDLDGSMQGVGGIVAVIVGGTVGSARLNES